MDFGNRTIPGGDFSTSHEPHGDSAVKIGVVAPNGDRRRKRQRSVREG